MTTYSDDNIERLKHGYMKLESREFGTLIPETHLVVKSSYWLNELLKLRIDPEEYMFVSEFGRIELRAKVRD